MPQWEDAEPISLGSWSRREICAKSDVDLLFAGPESAVREWMSAAQAAGLKVRSRVPENPKDWTQGVLPFDVLALLHARPLTQTSRAKLEAQQLQARPAWRARILKAIKAERLERRKRLDGISNYLEPNIKFGAGGLRDIEQALAIQDLFREKFSEDGYVSRVLTQVKSELLLLRQWLHLKGGGDILSAADQMELWRIFGFSSHKEFMRRLQNQLERASFYADWVVARSQIGKKSLIPEIKTAQRALALLEKPTVLHQYEIRRQVVNLVNPIASADRGALLQKAIKPKRSDDFLVALHRTLLIEHILPHFRMIKGLVQHDHYHRFTVDAHLVQTLRETQRSESYPQTLGRLSSVAKRLNKKDWWILKLTALFHDLAKGREGDHSTEGARLVEKTFTEWGFADSLREDVQWLVLNHLILSTAAFRRNPKEKSTWRMLMERGVTGRRLDLLTIFTSIDIRATNPEAWTPWKSQLLFDLNSNMRSEPVQKLDQLLRKVGPRQHALRDAIMKLDPQIIESISGQTLREDLSRILNGKGDLPPLVIRDKKNQIWVRFHAREDSPGLFLSFVRKLFGWGLPVQASAVMTIEKIGVYDWFLLKTRNHPKQISKWLTLPLQNPPRPPQVRFDSIEVVSQDDEKWIFSFRGKDQKGLLLAAANKLFDLGLSIHWAQVHTWGRQIDDIFCVGKGDDIGRILQTLRQYFVT